MPVQKAAINVKSRNRQKEGDTKKRELRLNKKVELMQSSVC